METEREEEGIHEVFHVFISRTHTVASDIVFQDKLLTESSLSERRAVPHLLEGEMLKTCGYFLK